MALQVLPCAVKDSSHHLTGSIVSQTTLRSRLQPLAHSLLGSGCVFPITSSVADHAQPGPCQATAITITAQKGIEVRCIHSLYNHTTYIHLHRHADNHTRAHTYLCPWTYIDMHIYVHSYIPLPCMHECIAQHSRACHIDESITSHNMHTCIVYAHIKRHNIHTDIRSCALRYIHDTTLHRIALH